MLTSKRHEWILQLIKGPEITPVGNSPGQYTSNSAVSICADQQQVTVSPTDVLDLSNLEFLVVHSGDRECTIPWNEISSLYFEQEQMTTVTHRPPPAAASSGLLPFSIQQKKTV